MSSKDSKSNKSDKPKKPKKTYRQSNILDYIFKDKKGFILFDQSDESAVFSTVCTFKEEDDVYKYILKSYPIDEYYLDQRKHIDEFSSLELYDKHGPLKFYVNFKTNWDKIVNVSRGEE